MGAQNKVIAGDYEGKHVDASLGMPSIIIGIFDQLMIDKSTVDSYEVVGESQKKSAASAVGRAAVGAFILGPIGIAAAVSAKSKGIYTIALQFRNGKRSLLEVDDKIYKAILKKVF